ncbi:uncharacterized protein LOC121400092 [Xenopus laevis]|uniref:Uncharacterized protein LOC121400092 n=1 Tax=Xenopus laevis TaxID=8355 RepID=A0A8J1MAR4_XENLA|nr:uncharacterized protein LOC121400092 [Xenopus laevis]XP_041438796.1 uncharacterized protein LOC121400092 [Xenopus laevis]XP_041438797.1 uncharacterized protein LOC121400092 [Xenopus laevis]
MGIQNVTGQYNWTFTANSKWIICANATNIAGRRVPWQSLLHVWNIDSATQNLGHIKRLTATCIPVATIGQKIILHINIVFPAKRSCHNARRKRAWYDTLLGGYGTLAGTLNSFDIETLANRMHKAGGLTNDAVVWQAKWMPTIWAPLQQQVEIDKNINNMELEVNNFSLNFDTNMKKFVNWTVCTLQTIYEQQQKDNMKTLLMTGNEQVWRTVFNRTQEWIQIYPHQMVCNDTICKGTVILFNITRPTIMCKDIVMPLIISGYFWQPLFVGAYIDNKNRTHNLENCEDTYNGKVCKLQSSVYEPCLLQNSINQCLWTVLPLSYEWMLEISPQVICVVTNQSVIPKMQTPFVGCIHNVSAFTWQNQTFLLSPNEMINITHIWTPHVLDPPNWNLSLHRLERIMNSSNEVRDVIVRLNNSLAAHQLYTTIVAQKIVKLGSTIADATSHHWYDVFTGYSPSAEHMFSVLIHPLLIIMICMCILTIWNCYVFYGMCCKPTTQQIKMVTYGRINH